MERRSLLVATLALFGASTLSRAAKAAADTERYGKQKVVYHINGQGGPESKKYKGAMRNIQNHINAVGAENLTIAVVTHGNGVGNAARGQVERSAADGDCLSEGAERQVPGLQQHAEGAEDQLFRRSL